MEDQRGSMECRFDASSWKGQVAGDAPDAHLKFGGGGVRGPCVDLRRGADGCIPYLATRRRDKQSNRRSRANACLRGDIRRRAGPRRPFKPAAPRPSKSIWDAPLATREARASELLRDRGIGRAVTGAVGTIFFERTNSAYAEFVCLPRAVLSLRHGSLPPSLWPAFSADHSPENPVRFIMKSLDHFNFPKIDAQSKSQIFYIPHH